MLRIGHVIALPLGDDDDDFPAGIFLEALELGAGRVDLETRVKGGVVWWWAEWEFNKRAPPSPHLARAAWKKQDRLSLAQKADKVSARERHRPKRFEQLAVQPQQRVERGEQGLVDKLLLRSRLRGARVPHEAFLALILKRLVIGMLSSRRSLVQCFGILLKGLSI